MNLRLFIALELPKAFLHDLERDLADLRETHPEYRWTRMENQHLTLAFLGSVPEQGVSLILKALNRSAVLWREGPKGTATHESKQTNGVNLGRLGSNGSDSGIRISARGIYTFPPRKPASVLAVGLGEGAETLRTLAAMVERELLAIKDEAPLSEYVASRRPFTPHITVARAGRNPIRLEPGEDQITLTARGLVASAALMSSILERGGPVYTVLGRVFL